MKNLNSYLTVFLLSFTLICSATTNPVKLDSNTTVVNKIESYLTSVDFHNYSTTVTVFSDFLVVENGDLYNIDFMLLENNEVVVLTKTLEEEYYIVENYSTQNLVKSTVAVANINPEKGPKL